MNKFRVIVMGMSFLFLGHLVGAQVGSNWTQVTASAPWSARYWPGAVVFNGRMWVLGGNTGSSYTNDVWSSSDGTNWTQATPAAPWSPRYGLRAVVFNGQMWVLGGNTGSSYTNDVWSSSDGTNWTQATPAASWGGRMEFASAVFNGRMWVLGGRVSNTSYFNDIWSSSDGTNWTQATPAASWSARGGLNTPVLDGQMWVLGGSGYSGYFNDVWSSPDGTNWTQATPAASWSARDDDSAVVFNGQMWVLGGHTGSSPVNDVWSSSDGTNWTQATAAAPWSPRFSFAAVVFNNQMWVLGGTGSSPVNDVWASTPPLGSTNSWTDGSNKWENPADWSLGVAPSLADSSDYITNASTKTVTIDATTATNFPSTMSVNYLAVIGSMGSTNTLLLNNAGTAIPLQILGDAVTLDTNSFMVVNKSVVLASNSTVSVGLGGANNTLIVTNRGEVFSGYGYIGYGSAASNNTAIVSGSGSVWSNGNDLTVGNAGAGNQLIITNGAAIFDDNGNLGIENNSANNSALVTGTGTVWSNQSAVNLYNSASLTIANGGAVYSAGGNVGANNGDGNAVLVTGSGSVWDINGQLRDGEGGEFGAEQLTIANGGAVFASAVYISGDNGLPILLVTGTGSVCSITGELRVFDGALAIANGAVVYSGSGTTVDDGGTSILVTDSGSVWDISGVLNLYFEAPGSGMTVANGAAVYSSGGAVAGQPSRLAVTGTGSVWSNSADLTIGGDGGDVSMTITNGGVVYNANAVVGTGGDEGDLVLVSGPGSLWSNSGDLSIGGRYENQLTITDGATVLASNVYGNLVQGGNQITVSGGALYVTNALGNGVLDEIDGTLTFNGGTVTVDSLVATNGANSVFTFNAGTLTSGGTVVTNNQHFVVGDGTDAATFQLNGGVHSFANNLLIDTNATLSGCGTVNGNVVVDPGGTVLANCGGTLNFTGIVTNNGSIYALNGTTLNFYGPVVNNGLINGTMGYLQFLSGVQNNGTIVPSAASALRITSITRQGNDISVSWICVGGNTYALQSTKSTAMIAEYATNFADASPIIVTSGTGLSTTNYLDVGAAYAPMLTAPGGTMVTTSVAPSTVYSSAVETRGIADSLGHALPVGSLLMLGAFSISESTIQSNFTAGNISAIMSNFTLYATAFAVGDGTALPASWDVSRSAPGFDGQQIYLLAVDAPTLATANHLGIFTAPSWIFPSGGGTNTIALENVTDFVIGAQGGPLTINLVLGNETYTFNDTARLSVLPGRILFYRVRLVQ
jgi:T5SS/PEP-CTERM-associated repeat protein